MKQKIIKRNHSVEKNSISPGWSKRIKMLFCGKWSFINYRREFGGLYPVSGWLPKFSMYWMNDVWQLELRGYAVSCDMRVNWLADMINPNRPNR
jgi:hypothetical protein